MTRILLAALLILIAALALTAVSGLAAQSQPVAVTLATNTPRPVPTEAWRTLRFSVVVVCGSDYPPLVQVER